MNIILPKVRETTKKEALKKEIRAAMEEEERLLKQMALKVKEAGLLSILAEKTQKDPVMLGEWQKIVTIGIR
ncbi:hypothetical protein KAW55_02000 [bacterium]|nr:hypothetical protein [bacterium]